MITHGLVICTPTPARFAGNRKEPDHFLFADHSPRIVGALPLMDSENLVAQCTAVCDIRRGFLEPLRNGYDNSRAHKGVQFSPLSKSRKHSL